MTHEFDPGYVAEPFRTLCEEYPGADVYPSSQFRLEWGPIFHRGRLDGSARVLVIGQDPAQHETIVRRVLVGEAGLACQLKGATAMPSGWLEEFAAKGLAGRKKRKVGVRTNVLENPRLSA